MHIHRIILLLFSLHMPSHHHTSCSHYVENLLAGGDSVVDNLVALSGDLGLREVSIPLNKL